MKTGLFVATLFFSTMYSHCSADVITINAANRGWFEEQGGNNGNSPNQNYIIGNCGLGDCEDGEFRSWFQFQIPALPGPIASARLIYDTADVLVEQGPSMTLTVTSLPAFFGFSNLGTGTFYGTRDYTIADDETTQSISLSAAALTDIEASQLGVFGTSGRLTAGASFGPTLPNQYIFGRSVGSDLTKLEITTVPEPTALALLGIGLFSVCRRPRR